MRVSGACCVAADAGDTGGAGALSEPGAGGTGDAYGGTDAVLSLVQVGLVPPSEAG